MRVFSTLAIVALAVTPVVATGQAPAAPAAAAPAPTFSSKTPIDQLVKNPAAKAVVEKYFYNFINSPQISQASGATLRDMQQYFPELMTDKALAKMDEELAKLPAAKK